MRRFNLSNIEYFPRLFRDFILLKLYIKIKLHIFMETKMLKNLPGSSASLNLSAYFYFFLTLYCYFKKFSHLYIYIA